MTWRGAMFGAGKETEADMQLGLQIDRPKGGGECRTLFKLLNSI